MLSISNILVPTDFSERSKAAFHLAAALARDHRAALTLLHVREAPIAPYAEFGAIPAPDLPDTKDLLDRLATFEPPDESLEVEYLVTDGEPGEEIVLTAKERHSDLIVMGTHGRTGLGRLLMGSVAERVMRHAPCPVLTLKSPIAATVPVEPEHATA